MRGNLSAPVKFFKLLSILVLMIFSLAACGGGGGGGADTTNTVQGAAILPVNPEICGDGIDQDGNGDDLACADVATTMAVAVDTGDQTVPNVIFFPDGSTLAQVNDPTFVNDERIFIFTNTAGDSFSITLDTNENLESAVFDDLILLFNYQGSYMDVAITDKAGSFTNYYSIDLAESMTGLYVGGVTSDEIREGSSAAIEAYGDLESALEVADDILTGNVSHAESMLQDALTISKEDLYSAALNGLAGDDEDAQIIVGIADIMVNHQKCVAGSATSCLSNIATTVGNLWELGEISLDIIEDSDRLNEMIERLKERMSDDDGDGRSEIQGDCDDTDPGIYRGANEICDDGIDQNCDRRDSVTDDCGVCDADSSNDNACYDCNNDPDGDAYSDNCGECVGGFTGKTECVKDCIGQWGGSAYFDNCGICVGGNSPSNPDWCVQDCDGVWGGSAVEDACGVCNGDGSSCDSDCNGVQNGSAYYDNCSICVGGNTGRTACVEDCNGVWGGSAVEDACGVCGGDGSSCVDCGSGSDVVGPATVFFSCTPLPSGGVLYEASCTHPEMDCIVGVSGSILSSCAECMNLTSTFPL